MPPPTGRAGAGPRRSDARQRRSALLAAVGELIAERGTEFPLTEAAERAGISTATAYRNFPDSGSAVDAYFAELMGDLLEAFAGLPADDDPIADIRRHCQVWVAQATRWGAAAVHMRSPRGLLAPSSTNGWSSTSPARSAGVRRPPPTISPRRCCVRSAPERPEPVSRPSPAGRAPRR